MWKGAHVDITRHSHPGYVLDAMITPESDLEPTSENWLLCHMVRTRVLQ